MSRWFLVIAVCFCGIELKRIADVMIPSAPSVPDPAPRELPEIIISNEDVPTQPAYILLKD